jgi:hypothetical protein
MSPPAPVTPAEAKAVWDRMDQPSTRLVARALTQSGRPVHFSTVARWKLEPPDQFGGLVLVEQAADRRVRHQRRGSLIEFVPPRITPPLDRYGRMQAGLNDAGGNPR